MTSSESQLFAPRDQFALAEYNNLRAEILKMIELQAQLISLTVIAFGTVVSVGFQTRNPAIMIVHPILALILGICWLNYAHAGIRAASYVREHLEVHFLGSVDKGWEHFVLGYKMPHSRVGYLGVRAIFAGSSTVAVLAAVYVGTADLPSIAAIIIGAFVTAVNVLLFLLYGEPDTTREDPTNRSDH